MGSRVKMFEGIIKYLGGKRKNKDMLRHYNYYYVQNKKQSL